jgi:tetratricopeptide (TPR) repeat protein
LLVLGVLTLVGLGLGTAGLFARARYHLEAAQQALQRHDLSEAHRHLERSLSQWRSARGLFLAAQTARRRDAYAEAEQLLADYVRRREGTPEGELEWLLLGVQQGDFAGQERSLQALVDREHPATPLILEALAKGYMNTFRWSDMVGCLDLLLQREPAHVPALVLRGKGWEGLRQVERAREDYQRAVELAPEASEGRLGLAEVLNRLGHVREAGYHYDVLRQRQPANPAVLLGRVRCHFDSHELEPAQQLLDTLLAQQPDHVAGLVERGRLAFRLGQLAEAETRLARAVTLAPWHREAHQLLHLCLEALGQRDAAQRCQARRRELEASDAQAGKLSLRFRGAPRDPAVRYEVGRWCLDNGQEQAGLRWLCASLLMDPRYGPTHTALADYFQRTGQPKRAARHHRLAQGGGVE